MVTIGFLDSASPISRGDELDAFFSGLANAGVTGQDAMVLYAWANNDYSLLPGLAQQLINNNVGVIVAAGGPVSALAAKDATSTKPIIFTTVTDPVGSGLVQSMDAPGGNLTGTWGHTTELDEPRLRALCDLTGNGKIGVLANPNRPFPKAANAALQKGGMENKASECKREAIVVNAGSISEIDDAFATFNGQVAGLLVTADPFFNSHRERVIELAANLGVPAIYQWSGFVADGGLMSYGPSKEEGYRNAGELAGDIIKNGARPATMPVRQTNKFALVINDKTAAKLNLNTSGDAFGRMVEKLGVTDVRHI
jgi:putative ABC transport system substrate-binding protein